MLTIPCIIVSTVFVIVVVVNIIVITISSLFNEDVVTSIKSIIDFGTMNNIIIDFD